jgi:hypothetical protein
MKRHLAVAALVIATASTVSSAFASGYGPAPFYRPDVDSTASPHWHWGRASPSANPVNDNGHGADVGNSSAPGSGGRAPSPIAPPTVPQQ